MEISSKHVYCLIYSVKVIFLGYGIIKINIKDKCDPPDADCDYYYD